MKYVRDKAVVGDHTVYVGTELRFKETSQYYNELKDESGHVPSAFVVGINRSGILWQADKDGCGVRSYSIEMFAKEFHVTMCDYNARNLRNIEAIELFEKFGGYFFGPNIETASIPLHRLFALIAHLKNG